YHVDDLALDVELVTGPGRRGPSQLSTEADDATRDRQAAVYLQPHGHGRGVPAAGHEAAEESLLRGPRVDMEWLRVELAGERDHLALVELVCAASESAADRQVLEVEPIRFRHRRPLGLPAARATH